MQVVADSDIRVMCGATHLLQVCRSTPWWMHHHTGRFVDHYNVRVLIDSTDRNSSATRSVGRASGRRISYDIGKLHERAWTCLTSIEQNMGVRLVGVQVRDNWIPYPRHNGLTAYRLRLSYDRCNGASSTPSPSQSRCI